MNLKLPVIHGCKIIQSGDIFVTNADILVNPVNCVGVMGAGLALQFKNRFPDNYRVYRNWCQSGDATIGKLCFYKTNNNQIIINFPTKDHWRYKSKYEYIEKGLITLQKYVNNIYVKSIAIPPLGCGLGGLEWDKVVKLIEQYPPLVDIIYICYKE